MKIVELGRSEGAAVGVRCGAVPRLERLRPNGVRSLRPGACGMVLRCVSGVVVVTQQGDPEDHALLPGDEFRTVKRGLVVAWALSESDVTVRALAAARAEARRAA